MAIVALLLAGCSSTQQFVHFPDQTKTVEDPKKGRIYFVRPDSLGGAVSADVHEGGRLIGSTGPKGYLCWEREPGDTTISSKMENTSAVALTVQASNVHYVVQHVGMGWVMARNQVEVVNFDQGRKMLRKCKPPKVVR